MVSSTSAESSRNAVNWRTVGGRPSDPLPEGETSSMDGNSRIRRSSSALVGSLNVIVSVFSAKQLSESVIRHPSLRPGIHSWDRPVARQLVLEISETPPVGALIEVDLGHDNRTPLRSQ